MKKVWWHKVVLVPFSTILALYSGFQASELAAYRYLQGKIDLTIFYESAISGHIMLIAIFFVGAIAAAGAKLNAIIKSLLFTVSVAATGFILYVLLQKAKGKIVMVEAPEIPYTTVALYLISILTFSVACFLSDDENK
jgi:hypothetical protein